MRDRVSSPPPDAPIVVLKFGSSVLEGAAGYRRAAAEVRRERAAGRRVLAVVSAAPGVTDGLLRSAEDFGPAPPPALVSNLVSTGEAASVALLAIALAAHGIAAEVLDGMTLGLRTAGSPLDADPVEVDAAALRRRLDTTAVVVVPGFVGVGADGGVTLLGRGGSDLSALFLAHRLDAKECRLVKDVDGVHAADPRVDPGAPVFRRASWEVILEVGGELVQPKAVRFARDRKWPFRVSGLGGTGTWVGPPAGVVEGDSSAPFPAGKSTAA